MLWERREPSTAETWSQKESRSKRVYRDVSRRRLLSLGRLIAKVFGPKALTVVDTMAKEAAAEAQRRKETLAEIEGTNRSFPR